MTACLGAPGMRDSLCLDLATRQAARRPDSLVIHGCVWRRLPLPFGLEDLFCRQRNGSIRAEGPVFDHVNRVITCVSTPQKPRYSFIFFRPWDGAQCHKGPYLRCRSQNQRRGSRADHPIRHCLPSAPASGCLHEILASSSCVTSRRTAQPWFFVQTRTPRTHPSPACPTSR